jgi:formate dehydrogenase iron-sulfur subunit
LGKRAVTALAINKQAAGSTALIDVLLAQERVWTAVDQFSNWHQHSDGKPRLEESYRRLIPTAEPGKGQQFAFEVDLDKCSGCKACVVACHSLNGLEETETWRKVGLLVGPPALQQHVTTACHHCVDPACLNGCPVLAYEKDPLTGIVRHLDDQCIGCQYCVMKCPYEVPQYSKRLGIVRKCDMCYHRLEAGEAPACSQACPSEAIRVTIVDQSAVTSAYRAATPESPDRSNTQIGAQFLPDSPAPSITLPSTRFLSNNRMPPTLVAADQFAVRVEPGHLPLVLMLLLSQAAAGLLIAGCFFAGTHFDHRMFVAPSLFLLAVGSLAAVLHLGQPLRAWRALLGWRSSWLSRELFALGVFGVVCTVTLVVSPRSAFAGFFMPASALVGMLAVFSSAMVYIDTQRSAWHPRFTLTNFFGTTLVLGAIGASSILALAAYPLASNWFVAAALALRAALFVWREFEHQRALSNPRNPVHLNSKVVPELLSWTTKTDALLFVCFAAAGLAALASFGPVRIAGAITATVTCFAGEVINRYLFFATSAGKRMPGGING